MYLGLEGLEEAGLYGFEDLAFEGDGLGVDVPGGDAGAGVGEHGGDLLLGVSEVGGPGGAVVPECSRPQERRVDPQLPRGSLQAAAHLPLCGVHEITPLTNTSRLRHHIPLHPPLSAFIPTSSSSRVGARPQAAPLFPTRPGYDAAVRTADFDYELDEGLIAQAPRPRGTGRLLVLSRTSGERYHRRTTDLPHLLAPGDLLVVNDTRVLAARLHARRPTGRRFELLLLRPLDETRWTTLLRPSARARVGEQLELPDGGRVLLEERLDGGRWNVAFEPSMDVERLDHIGEPPLPPYIKRPNGALDSDRTAYQTVFARRPGAVAAPTAGLHLTPEILQSLEARGIGRAAVTLHVGIGTFRPVASERVEDHEMHAEYWEIRPETARAVNDALARGRRIVCLGTTSVRALESALAAGHGRLVPGSGWSRLFIRPGYRFLGTGALITNFHLPKSTLLMLVSALAGREAVLAAYREAQEKGYRFFSYGDAMLIV